MPPLGLPHSSRLLPANASYVAMEQIETQATDLRHLTQPTAAAPGGHGHGNRHANRHTNRHANRHANLHLGAGSGPSRQQSQGQHQHSPSHHHLLQPYAQHSHHPHHSPSPYAPTAHHQQHQNSPPASFAAAQSSSLHNSYPRLPAADDRHHHAAMLPRAYGSPSQDLLGSPSPSASGRPPPPLLHSVSDAPPSHAASPQLPTLFSPDILRGHSSSGSHYGHMLNGANNSNAPAAPAAPAAPPPASMSAARTKNNNSSNASAAANTPGPGAQSPASYTGGTGGTGGTPSASGKRKQDDDESNPKQQRSKRNRYISIACNECKRRKIKCNGETPCQRCGNLSLACLYSPNCCGNSFKDSDEYKQMNDKIHNLEEQLELLLHTVNGLQQETQRLVPLHERMLHERMLPTLPSTVSPSPSTSIPSMNRPELPAVRRPSTFRGGPTSTAFTVDVAKNTLYNMGYSGEGNEEPGGPVDEESLRQSPALLSSARAPSLAQSLPRQTPSDPLWELFDKTEMIRLCRLHEDEVGIMYPVVKMDSVIEHAQGLSVWMESACMNNNTHSTHDGSSESSFLWPPNYDEAMADIRTLTLKIILCCALSVEEHGHSEKAIRLYESISSIVDAKLMSEPSDLANLPFLALVAGFRFLTSDEVLAWRIMGQVARHCLEQGLNRVEGIVKIPDEQERRNAINTFWSAYVLERRWSFSTGLPYVLHDDKIDPNLPYPEELPYLVAMITYSRLGAKIWTLVDFFEPAIIRDLKRDEFEKLDQEIMQWYDSCPESVKISSFDGPLPLPSTPTYNLERLQIWTRLRLNQIRIWLHTPVLHSASSINDNMEQAQQIVNLAKDTIQYLHRLNNGSSLYRRIQVFYHQFLTSAIAVLFLASTHRPVQFSANCRAEFYMAMNLVKDMSTKSYVSQRLWHTIRSLKAYAPRLGLQDEDTHTDAQPEAQPDAANLAGFHVPPNKSSNVISVQNLDSAPLFTQSTPSVGGPAARHSQPGPSLAKIGASSTSSPVMAPAGGTGPNQQTENGVLIQTEMTRIFEGYLGMSTIPYPPAATEDVTIINIGAGTGTGTGTDGAGASGSPLSGDAAGEGVYETLKSMF